MDEQLRLLSERLDRAERKNRRMNALVILVLATMGMFAFVTSCNAPNAARARELSTGRLVLTDEKGRTSVEIVAASDGPALRLYDSHGKKRLILGLVNDVPAVTLGNADGIGVAVLGAPPTGAGLMLYDSVGDPRAQFDVGVDGPRIYMEDNRGFTATLGKQYFQGDDAKNQKAVVASLVLAHKSLGTIWQAPAESALRRFR